MFRNTLAAAAMVLALTSGATSEQATTGLATADRPATAATLTGGALDLVFFYEMATDDQMKVTLSFAELGDPEPPMRMVLGLADGERVSFSAPDYPEARYHISRNGFEVTSQLEIIEFTEVAQID